MNTKQLLDACPLCKNSGEISYQSLKSLYYHCSICDGIFLSRGYYLSCSDEKKRYLEHKNDVNDKAYQGFVSPIVSFIESNFEPGRHKGLDFGAGTGPVASFMLELKGFEICRYDPFFDNCKEYLDIEYDFIFCCEVIEHFKKPYEEFRKLQGMLAAGGRLICMTSIYNDNIDFSKWYYKNDPTHVFIYKHKTLEWIKDAIKFSGLQIDKNLIIWNK